MPSVAAEVHLSFRMQVWGTCLGAPTSARYLRPTPSYNELLVQTDSVVSVVVVLSYRATTACAGCLIATGLLFKHAKVPLLAQSHPTTLQFTAAANSSKAFGTMFTKRVRPCCSFIVKGTGCSA